MEKKNAPKERKKQKRHIIKHKDGNSSGETAETSGRNRDVKSRKIQEEKLKSKQFLEEWKELHSIERTYAR